MTEPARALHGCRVWVTRPADRAGKLAALVRSVQGEAVVFPLVEIAPAPDAVAARTQLAAVGTAHDLVVFISRSAVRGALDLQPDLPARLPAGGVFAVGTGTAAELARYGVTATTGPGPAYGAADLLRHVQLGAATVRDRRLLIVKGVGGDSLLPDTLGARGARVSMVDVYQRRTPRSDPGATASLWHRVPPDVIVLTSTGAVAALVTLTPVPLHARLFTTALVVISARVAAAARSAGFTGVVQVAAAATDQGLLEALLTCKVHH